MILRNGFWLKMKGSFKVFHMVLITMWKTFWPSVYEITICGLIPLSLQIKSGHPLEFK